MINFVCPDCRTHLQYGEQYEGLATKCTACGCLLKVPKSSGSILLPAKQATTEPVNEGTKEKVIIKEIHHYHEKQPKKKLITLTNIILTILLLFVVTSIIRSVGRKSGMLSVGDDCILLSSGTTGQVLVYTSIEAYDRAIKSYASQDKAGALEVILANGVYLVDNWTKCKILESNNNYYEVRIMTGSQKIRRGYVDAKDVHEDKRPLDRLEDKATKN